MGVADAAPVAVHVDVDRRRFPVLRWLHADAKTGMACHPTADPLELAHGTLCGLRPVPCQLLHGEEELEAVLGD
eukprot:2982756-Alexandrium_andersonii.AAC.1